MREKEDQAGGRPRAPGELERTGGEGAEAVEAEILTTVAVKGSRHIALCLDGGLAVRRISFFILDAWLKHPRVLLDRSNRDQAIHASETG